MLGFAGMVLGQFMAVLDIQIVASSLAQIQAGIGASADEIAWVQTSYLLAEVVIMPLTAYMTRLWGTQSTFQWCCGLFILTSILAGFSTSFEMMIATRALQGLAAGGMIPTVFATAFTAFPPEKRLGANITMGMIVTLAPMIGPTLGGHLTDWLSWRWLFFLNLGPGLLAMFLVGRWGNFDSGDPSLKKGVDWWGLIAMTIALISIQLVLEEGAENSWFAEDYITFLTVIGVLTGGFFIWRQLAYHQPLINLRPFGNRNFSIGVTMNLVAGMALFGGVFIVPLYLAQVRGFSASETGITMLTGGAAMFLTSPLMRILMRFIEIRLAVFLGFALSAYAIGLGAHISDEWGFWEFAALQGLRGIGAMIAMIGAQQITISTLRADQMKDASAIVNLTRNIGGAVGLAMVSTVLTVKHRVHLSELSASVSQASYASQQMLAAFTQRMTERGVFDPEAAAAKALNGLIQRDAAVLSFGDAFAALAIASGVAGLLVFLASPAPKLPAKPAAGAH